jgi:hypothetical protein
LLVSIFQYQQLNTVYKLLYLLQEKLSRFQSTFNERYLDVEMDDSSETYRGVSKSFQTELIMKYMLTTINTHQEATQRAMAEKLTRLTHKIVIQLHLVPKSSTICSSHSMWPVWKLLVTPLYVPENEATEV